MKLIQKSFFKLYKTIFLFVLIFGMNGCSQNPNLATVDIAWFQMKEAKTHIVQDGDSLYSVAFRYDIDYRELANLNSLKEPFTITPDQYLKISPEVRKKAKTISHQAKARRKKLARGKIRSIKKWVWPTEGKVIRHFSIRDRYKGIGISGKLGQPIYAAAEGIVAYGGNGIKGYGNLLIIKHSSDVFSAYAHNSKLMVSEGKKVEAGQLVAYMGDDEAPTPMLHFEIRLTGKPINPLKYLPNMN